jgi:predicted GIY-YIG superfamily endonuclease
MPLHNKEEMRLYQQARRRRLRGETVTTVIQRFVTPVKPKMDIEEIKQLRSSAIPIDDGYKIYFLFQGDEVVYIGQTRSLLSRISAHQNGTVDTAKKDFDSISVVPSTKESVNDDERVYIGYYSPKHNKHNKRRQYVTEVGLCGNCNLLEIEIKKLKADLALAKLELEKRVHTSVVCEDPIGLPKLKPIGSNYKPNALYGA